MTLTWVICGAGRGVGKTRLALGLCRVLPDAVYAKQGCGTWQADRPANFFRTEEALATFLATARRRHQHIVVESNALARRGAGDVIIFVEGMPGHPSPRADADALRSGAHLIVGPNARPDDWNAALPPKLEPATLRDAVCSLLAAQARPPDEQDPGLRRVELLRVPTDGAAPVSAHDHVVTEQLVTIMIEDVGNFALLCTPCDVEALAIGFAFSERLISSLDDVATCSYQPEQPAVGLRLESPPTGAARRNLIVTSSCGLCGHRNVEQLLASSAAKRSTLHVPATIFPGLFEQMRARQALFQRTGGAHAAGIFTGAGEIVAFAEDIGRHNAVDKAIGKCLLEGRSTAGHGIALSGRVSLELVAKAGRAGLELIAAVSAPSSLAIEAAEHCNITLCGFVRGRRAAVYTHPHRVGGG